MKARCERCGETDEGTHETIVEKRVDGHTRPLLCWRCYAEQLEEDTALTERQAEVWALKDSGLSLAEAGEVLGVSRGTAKSTWHKAKERRQEGVKTGELTRDPADMSPAR